MCRKVILLQMARHSYEPVDRQQNKPKNPTTTTVPQNKIILVLPYLGVQSKVFTKQLNTCIIEFYGCINLRVILKSAYRIKSLFPYKDGINRSRPSKVVFLAVGTARIFIGKTKRRLNGRKTEHFKAITSSCHISACYC